MSFSGGYYDIVSLTYLYHNDGNQFPSHKTFMFFKAAPWDDINFRFYFRTEVVYPTDHVFFQNFHIFINIFNQHFYETRSNPNKLFVYLKDD